LDKNVLSRTAQGKKFDLDVCLKGVTVAWKASIGRGRGVGGSDVGVRVESMHVQLGDDLQNHVFKSSSSDSTCGRARFKFTVF